MKQSLQLGLSQHLAMTPRLQQAIRLLQLSTLELHTEIQEALDSNSGRPTGISVLFLATRLDELSRNELARKLERALLNSFKGVSIEHLLFVLVGNPPRSLLHTHLSSLGTKQIPTHGIAVYLADHQTFIQRFFSEY